MKYVTTVYTTAGATGHRFKDQLTSKIASKLWNLTYIHAPFQKDPWDQSIADERKWEDFWGFGDNELRLQDINPSNKTIIDTTAWCGFDPEKVAQIIDGAPEGTLIEFRNSARLLLEQIPASMRNSIVEELRKKYFHRRQINPIQTYFNPSVLNIALHIRRGRDVIIPNPDSFTDASWRYIPDNYYLSLISNLRTYLPYKANFHIYSEGSIQDFKNYQANDIFLHLCPWPPQDYQLLFNNFHHLITADILVTGCSEFSYILAHLNPNLTMTLPIERVVSLPAETRHILTRTDGTFDLRCFRAALAQIENNQWERSDNIEVNSPFFMKAYIKSDEKEDPEVINSLTHRLRSNGLEPVFTNKLYKDIKHKGPFLYFRNAYLRFDVEREIAHLHRDSSFSSIYTSDDELIAYNPNGGGYSFHLHNKTYLHSPKHKPLPIMISTATRATYLELTLNSLIYNLKSPDQIIYIIASEPTKEVMDVIVKARSKSHFPIRVAHVPNTLLYAGTNFGSKFFNVDKFIIWDDDTLLPPSYDYLVPFWTQQINHRMTTADFVSFTVGGRNAPISFLKCKVISPFILGEFPLPEPYEVTWHYQDINLNDRRLLSFGTVCMSGEHMLRGYKEPLYFKADMDYYVTMKSICMLNIPVFHLGGNQEMDYPQRPSPVNKSISRFQTGIDLDTGLSKTIDMAADWKEFAH